MLEANSLEPVPADVDSVHRIEAFDPKAEPEAKRNAVPLDGIVARAHKLLKERTAAEIHAGAELINWLLRAPAYLKRSFGDLTAVADASSASADTTVRWLAQSDVVALARCVDLLSPPQLRSFREAHWHELFAILALCYVDQVLREDAREDANAARDSRNADGGDDTRRLWTSFSLARQAISLAEQLAEESRRGERTKSKPRNPQRAMLKSLVVETAHLKYPAFSKRRAAIAVFKELADSGRVRYDEKTGELFFDQQHVLSNDDPAHRFAIWIGKARKLSRP